MSSSTLGLLWLLATLDASFAGWRDAAGRSGLIRKRAYYRRALLRGALAGQVAVLVAGAVAAALVLASTDRAALLADLDRAGQRLLLVYVPYAAVILAAFLVRTIPVVDVKATLSSVVFGPLSLARPLVVVAGLAWGIAESPRVEVVLLAAIILPMMLLFERALGVLRRA